MLYILRHFEKTAAHLDSTTLVVSGSIALLLGLIVWLVGTALRKPLAAVTGAVVGCTIGLLTTGRSVASLISIGLAAALAIVFERLFITIFAALLAAAVGFVLLANPYVMENPGTIPMVLQNAQNYQGTLNAGQTAEVVKEYAITLFARLKYICSQITALKSAVITSVVAAILIIGFFFGRLITALAAATTGTTLVFAGMILLLLYKGAEPVSLISGKQQFYTAVFVAMIVFGTVEQCLLCKRFGKKKTPAAKKDTHNQNTTEYASFDWRST